MTSPVFDLQNHVAQRTPLMDPMTLRAQRAAKFAEAEKMMADADKMLARAAQQWKRIQDHAIAMQIAAHELVIEAECKEARDTLSPPIKIAKESAE